MALDVRQRQRSPEPAYRARYVAAHHRAFPSLGRLRSRHPRAMGLTQHPKSREISRISNRYRSFSSATCSIFFWVGICRSVRCPGLRPWAYDPFLCRSRPLP